MEWKKIRRGVWLEDEFQQRCVVVKKRSGTLITRRFDSDGYWNVVAEWARDTFEQRQWKKIKAPTKKRQPRFKE